MFRYVLEGLFIFIWALRRLPQNEAITFLCQVTTFLVSVRTLCNLHHESCIFAGEVLQQLQVKGRTKIVAVGHKHILFSLSNELIKLPTSQQGGIQVAVAWRAPLVLWVL